MEENFPTIEISLQNLQRSLDETEEIVSLVQKALQEVIDTEPPARRLWVTEPIPQEEWERLERNWWRRYFVVEYGFNTVHAMMMAEAVMEGLAPENMTHLPHWLGGLAFVEFRAGKPVVVYMRHDQL